MYEKTLAPGEGARLRGHFQTWGTAWIMRRAINTRIQKRICPATFLPAANSLKATVAIGSQVITGAISGFW